jgi:tRNA G10  N-methylase Trm11
MKRKRHTPEEIIRKLRTAEDAMAGGRTIEEACRVIAVSMATYQRWKGRCSGVKKDALKRLRERERENIRLMKLVADHARAMANLKEVAEGKWQARHASERRWPLYASVWK